MCLFLLLFFVGQALLLVLLTILGVRKCMLSHAEKGISMRCF